MQQTSIAPTERITVTGADTVREIVSTITLATALLVAEMNRKIQINREELLRMERDHAKEMSVLQQMTDIVIDQVQTELRDSGQCYRALLQENDKAMSRVTYTIRWNTIMKQKRFRNKMTLL